MVSTNKHFQLSDNYYNDGFPNKGRLSTSKKTHFTLYYKKYLSGSNYLRFLVGDTLLNHYSDISDKQIV